MKTNLLLILAVSVLFISIVSAQPAQELVLEKGVAPHAKLDNVYRRFSEAYRKLDADAVVNLYTDDALYLARFFRAFGANCYLVTYFCSLKIN